MKRTILTILTVLWMLLIFSFSNQKAVESTEVSNSFIEKTIVKVYKVFDSNFTLDKEKDIVKKYTVLVRKTAHFSVYLILGILIYLTLISYGVEKNVIIVSILSTMLYAISDEFHQFFIEGRSCELFDVLIDTAGGSLGVLIFQKIGRLAKY